MKPVFALTPNDQKRLVALRNRLNEFVGQFDGRRPRRRRRKAKATATAKPAKKAPAKPAKKRPGLKEVPDVA